MYLCSRVTERLSVIWQQLQPFLPSCGSARGAKICTIREKTAGVNSLVQRYAGWQSKQGQQRRQYGEQLAQGILLAALCLAYHNRGSGRFPNNGRGWEDGRAEGGGLRGDVFSKWTFPYAVTQKDECEGEEHTNTRGAFL